jgi:hypothetical protein
VTVAFKILVQKTDNKKRIFGDLGAANIKIVRK